MGGNDKGGNHAHAHTVKLTKVCRDRNQCAHTRLTVGEKMGQVRVKLWYSHVLKDWHSLSPHHTYKKKKERRRRRESVNYKVTSGDKSSAVNTTGIALACRHPPTEVTPT